MKESRQEHQRKGKQSVLKGSKESAINGKHKDSECPETLAVSATMRTNVENQRAHPLLLQNRRQNSIGTVLRKDGLSEAKVRLGRDMEGRAKTTSVGNAQTPRVIYGSLPCVRITKPNRAANSVISALLCTERLTVSQTNDRKRMVVKVLLPY